ncbi:hypothetical protein C7444_102328 [Sphaerotilus hippei]|uniref:Response regulatory domain-containing protein n=1 Tax=Sphaerotilus hippei TaxID=744406 RepID=A0A318H5U0_9BURK|nr:response regulator [Sphaerotilus hippei]PXW98837.1 hypothetical protein C7444_102328 [Sphaerotilus hippei]
MNSQRPILLVEDNPMDVDLTLRAFARRHIVNPMQIARDGEEALDLVNAWREGDPLPAVILLDLKLPRIDGLEVLRHLKNHPVYQKIPVVMLTTSREDADVATAYTLGANSYIVKPVDFEKFMDVATQIQLYWCVLNERAL